MKYLINDNHELMQSVEVAAKNILDERGLSVEYYHLLEYNTLHVDFPDAELCSSAIEYYLVLTGELQFQLSDGKVIISTGQSIELPPQRKESFDVYANKETRLIHISTDTEVVLDCKLDKLTEGIREVEDRDIYTKNHNYRVGKYASMIMQKVDPTYSSNELNLAGCYHDIGKCDISTEILKKDGCLNDEEFEQMKQHPIKSFEMLKPILGEQVAYIARWHHEKLDGSGYPDGIKGDKIPLEARVLALADIFDALTSRRTYHGSYSFNSALEIIGKDVQNGKLDKRCYEALVELVKSGVIVPGIDNVLQINPESWED